MTKQETIKYLTNVICNWEKFTKTHRLFTEAIKTIIESEEQNA